MCSLDTIGHIGSKLSMRVASLRLYMGWGLVTLCAQLA